MDSHLLYPGRYGTRHPGSKQDKKDLSAKKDCTARNRQLFKTVYFWIAMKQARTCRRTRPWHVEHRLTSAERGLRMDLRLCSLGCAIIPRTRDGPPLLDTPGALPFLSTARGRFWSAKQKEPRACALEIPSGRAKLGQEGYTSNTNR